jgi:hypothetical protein
MYQHKLYDMIDAANSRYPSALHLFCNRVHLQSGDDGKVNVAVQYGNKKEVACEITMDEFRKYIEAPMKRASGIGRPFFLYYHLKDAGKVDSVLQAARRIGLDQY